MNPIVQQITQKTGISQDHATTAVETVVGFLKKKLPAPMASQLDRFVSEEEGASGEQQSAGGEQQSAGGGQAGEMAGKLGGMMGGKQ